MQRYIWNELSKEAQEQVLRRPALANDTQLRNTVTEIISRVRNSGDSALLELTEQFDAVRLDSLEVTEEEFEQAESCLSEEQSAAIRAAAANIEKFHAAQLPSTLAVDTAPGVHCERLSRPINSVGMYVPAGSAPLPSTALMLGVPAKLAGCPFRILCSPAQANGQVDAAVLYAARISDVSRVFKLGGAQAIAAMAYGTESVPKVNKVYGPGNAWVTEAKAQVDQDPAAAVRDYPAGPSELLVIADEQATVEFLAADLLSQAEHGPDSQVLLLTTSTELASQVMQQIDLQTARLPRREIIEQSLEHSSVIIVDDIAAAIELSNRYAPEHLILQLEQARNWLPQVQAAGSVFLGRWAPESVGDYCSGTNHVLPTYGYARQYSSLGVGDFMRSMTVQELTPDGLRNIGPIAETLARLEGLDAHAQAVSARLAVLDARGTR